MSVEHVEVNSVSPDANVANVLYNFAGYVEAAVTSGLTDGLIDRAHEVKDLALEYLVDDFRESA